MGRFAQVVGALAEIWQDRSKVSQRRPNLVNSGPHSPRVAPGRNSAEAGRNGATCFRDSWFGPVSSWPDLGQDWSEFGHHAGYHGRISPKSASAKRPRSGGVAEYGPISAESTLDGPLATKDGGNQFAIDPSAIPMARCRRGSAPIA